MDGQIIELLKQGKIGVIPTDTIHGVVGSALRQETVEEIYRLRKRTPSKPMIILIGEASEVEQFGVSLTEEQRKILERVWPGKVSVILPCNESRWEYLHRGTNSLAFRVPNDEALREMLRETGPLVAPSANWEGEKPTETSEEAKRYFGEEVFYVDAGKLASKASTLVKLESSKLVILRQGEVEVDEDLIKES